MDDLVAKATAFAEAVEAREARLREEQACTKKKTDEVKRLFGAVVVPAKDEALRRLRDLGFTADQGTTGQNMFEVQIGKSGLGSLRFEAGETLRVDLKSKQPKNFELQLEEITTDRIVGCFVELVETLHNEFEKAKQTLKN